MLRNLGLLIAASLVILVAFVGAGFLCYRKGMADEAQAEYMKDSNNDPSILMHSISYNRG
jgi:hypothetical protein